MFFFGFKDNFRRCVAMALALAMVCPPVPARAQSVALPPVGQRIALTQAFDPTVLNALTVDPKNPLRFDFFVNEGQDVLPGSDPKEEARQEQYQLLIKDFLTALTIPESQLWVNLSPYEKDRIIDERFGLTEMGRDLLAQDYLLKQITAGLLYPEENIGRDFWTEVYRLAQDKFGTTDIPVDTFNKVWIMPDTAEVYQQGTTALVVKHHLKVLMEADYMAMQGALVDRPADNNASHEIARKVMRTIIIPILEKEVNDGKNFARLRQIYNALILAAWYKKAMRESFLGKAYVDQGKVKGISQRDAGENLRIYAQYVEAFRKGAFSYIKEEVDHYSGEVIPRKYFSGGFTEADFSQRLVVTNGLVGLDKEQLIRDAAAKKGYRINVDLAQSVDAAQKKEPVYKAVLPKESVQAQHGEDVPAMPDIKKLADEIHALQPYEEYPIFSRTTEVRKMKIKLRSMIMDAFRKYMEGEDHYEELVETFHQVIYGEETGLRSLAMSGTYTLNVFRLFRGVALFARAKSKIPMDEVLDILGLDAELKPFFRNALTKINSEKGYAKFYADLLTYLPAANTSAIDNVFTQDAKDDQDPFNEERNKSWKNPEADNDQEKWVAKKILEAKDKFASGYRFLETVTGGTVSDADNLMFLRAKKEMSALEKVTDGDTQYYLIKDLIAGREAFPDIAKLGEAADRIDKDGIMFSNYRAKIDQDRKLLLAKKPLLKGRELKKVIHQLLLLENIAENYKYKQRVVVVKKNYFASGAKDWYRAMHYVFMLGEGLWTIEVQLKTLRATILHDFEHKVKYKRKVSKEFENYGALVNLIWLLDAVEAANYCHSKDKGLTIKAMEKYFGEDAAQVNGGIDVRNVEEGLTVAGQGSLINVDGVNIPDGMIEGFIPLIRSIVPVQGILLKNIPLSSREKDSELVRL